MDSYYTLYQEGIKSDRVLCVGNLVGDMLKYILPHTPSASEILTGAKVPSAVAESSEGFALITIEAKNGFNSARAFSDLVSLLCELGNSLPVVWSLSEEMMQNIQTNGAASRLEAARVILLPAQGYLQLLGLLENCKCLVSGAENMLMEEAASLRVPSVRLSYDVSMSTLLADGGMSKDSETSDGAIRVILWQLANSTPPQEAPGYWDSGTATRIANHLLLCIPKSETLSYAGA
jgi:UDP-N-acetylglucosamine 2-epimerase